MAVSVWRDSTVTSKPQGQRANWNKKGPEILDRLTEWVPCDFAIIRNAASDAQYLILDGYKPGRQRGEDDDMGVPMRKSLRFWKDNAFISCFVQHYEHGSLSSPRGRSGGESYTKEEEAFLSRVHWRGSFPIDIGDGNQRLVILVAFDDERPTWLDRNGMCLAWLAAQIVANGEVLCDTVRHIPVITYLDSMDRKLSVLLRLLCSGRGLGWQRAWLMKKERGALRCVSCAGGLTGADWGRGASYASSELQDLTDEIAHDVLDRPLRQDDLFRLCVDQGKFMIDADAFDLDRTQEDSPVLFSIPEELEFDGSGRWLNALSELAQSHGMAYEDCDERIYSCPFQFENDEFVAFLSWSQCRADSAAPHPIETGVVLATASQVMADDPEFICIMDKLLSWLAIAMVSKDEFDDARVRRVGQNIRNVPEYRDRIRERILGSGLHDGPQQQTTE